MAHLIRFCDPKTRKPTVDGHGRALYLAECPTCGVVTRGLAKRAAEVRAASHRCASRG